MSRTQEERDPFRLGARSLGGPARLIERISRLDQLRQVYLDAVKGVEARAIPRNILDRLNIASGFTDADARRIPPSGPAVVVANHPFGGIESLVLLELVLRVRADAKMMANHLVARIPEMHPLCVFVDPYDRAESAAQNIRPMLACVRWLQRGGLLIVFPSGDVSGLDVHHRTIRDPEWNESIARLIRVARAPVVPVFFEGANGPLFQIAGLVHPRLRTAMLPSEFVNKRNRRIAGHVGRPIPFKRLKLFASDADMIRYLRVRCHILAHCACEAPRRGSVAAPAIGPILPASEAGVLEQEVRRLPEEQRLPGSESLHVYYAAAGQIPEVLREIGRLREITFCAAGEGTGRLLDLDRFDAHYLHLFLWNTERREVVGAYRLGLVDDLTRRFGVRGLYTRTLFRYGHPLLRRMAPAIELGRSFVRPEYQRAYAPLLLLWRGIGQFIARHPKYRYLFGPVSVSREYNAYSRYLLALFLESNNLNEEMARATRALHPPRAVRCVEATRRTFRTLVTDIDAVSELIEEIEPDHKGVPVLVRQYLRLGGQIIAFNIDPQFKQVLDVLMAIDVAAIPRAVMARFMTPEKADAYLEFRGRDPHSASKPTAA